MPLPISHSHAAASGRSSLSPVPTSRLHPSAPNAGAGVHFSDEPLTDDELRDYVVLLDTSDARLASYGTPDDPLIASVRHGDYGERLQLEPVAHRRARITAAVHALGGAALTVVVALFAAALAGVL